MAVVRRGALVESRYRRQTGAAVFLESMSRVDMRDGLNDDSLDKLRWGITGNKS